MALPIEPDTLDAHTSTGVDTIATVPMGGSLLTKDPTTHEYKPNLAEEYKVSEDGKTLTFKNSLRRYDAQWNTGNRQDV